MNRKVKIRNIPIILNQRNFHTTNLTMNKFSPPWLFRKLCPATYRLAAHEDGEICLTFDDGPGPETTRKILSILDRYHVKATFFCVGDNVKKYPELYDEIRAAGHSVGNHTMHHIDGWKSSAEDYMADVAQAQKFIDTKLFRPPHGRITPRQLSRVKNQGFEIVQWDVITYDWSKDYTPQQICDIAIKHTRPGSIIVFHDSIKAAPRTLAILDSVIKTLTDKGFKFTVYPPHRL